MLNIRSVAQLFVITMFLTACAISPSSDTSATDKADKMTKQSQSQNLSMFAEASENMQRFVIMLPQKTREQETAFSVELQIGKIMETDGVNRLFSSANIEKQTLEGWGYHFYKVNSSSLENIASTNIGVPAGMSPKIKYVALGSKVISYNSRLPIVIYSPKDTQVRYRIWSADEEFSQAVLR